MFKSLIVKINLRHFLVLSILFSSQNSISPVPLKIDIFHTGISIPYFILYFFLLCILDRSVLVSINNIEQNCCSVTKSCLSLCNSMDCSTPDFPVLHYLPEFAQTHVHWVSDAIQPYHPLYISLKELLVSQIVFQERRKKPKEADKAVGKLYNFPSHSPFCVNDFIHN